MYRNTILDIKQWTKMHNISKKPCFPSTRKVLDFDLNGQHMRKAEITERHWVLGCSPPAGTDERS